jgi:hypothetical protein
MDDQSGWVLSHASACLHWLTDKQKIYLESMLLRELGFMSINDTSVAVQ